jgi:hypothetical protein
LLSSLFRLRNRKSTANAASPIVKAAATTVTLHERGFCRLHHLPDVQTSQPCPAHIGTYGRPRRCGPTRPYRLWSLGVNATLLVRAVVSH